ARRALPAGRVAMARASRSGIRQFDRRALDRHDRAGADHDGNAGPHHRTTDRGTGRYVARWRMTVDPDPIFQALADPTRRTLIRALSDIGPSTLAELSA